MKPTQGLILLCEETGGMFAVVEWKNTTGPKPQNVFKIVGREYRVIPDSTTPTVFTNATSANKFKDAIERQLAWNLMMKPVSIIN